MSEELIQGSPEWLKIRLGKVTASRIADMVAKTKSGWGAGRANYAAQLVAERLTGEAQESYTNSAMQHGIDTEPHARAAYEFQTDAKVAPIGFVTHPKIEMTGASPDGLIGADGLIEIKCPNTATHISTLLGREVPSKYLLQMQWQMACAERQWCDFVSFDPRMPPAMQLFVHRLERDNTVIDELEKEAQSFLDEVETTVKQLRTLYG